MRESLRRNKGNFIILLLIAGIVSIPLMTDYVIMGNSTASSLARIENISVNCGKVFPVRVGALGDSPYGYSTSAFQADIFYGIPVLFRLIGMSLGNAFKLTLFLFNILTAFTAFFCFRKCLGNHGLGLAAAMLYTWCPYRITSLYTAGNLSEVFAWTFIPIVILGLWELYGEQDLTLTTDHSDKNKGWITLTWGFSLIALSSTVFLFVTAALSALLFLIMWRKSFQKKILIEIAKTIAGVVCINAWFLIPMLLRMRDPEAVGVMIAKDIRGLGMFFTQYLTVFNFAGNNASIWAGGMCDAPAYEPGAAVTLLVFVCLYLMFTGAERPQDTAESGKIKSGVRFTTAIFWAGIVFMILSTNTFPWDLFQDRNMLFSIILAMMESPARWGIAADICLLLTAFHTISRLGTLYGEKVRSWALLATTAVSFGTTQFLLGHILTGCGIAREQEIEAFGNIELPVIYGESILWRLCEIVSLISVLLCMAVWLMGRRKRVKKV